MSNQCSDLLAHRSFYLFNPFHKTLRLYSITCRPIFPFDNNLGIASSRSRRSRRSYHPPTPLLAQSSSDVVLIATTEHHDGSLVFRFGDASEVVKNDEVLEEIESKGKWESNGVEVLGDQITEVIVKTIEREEGGGEGILTEVADDIRNGDINSDIAQRETSVTSDLRDNNAESSKSLSDISEDEVHLLQSDDNMSSSLEGVESVLETRECIAQFDGDESLNPMNTSFLDNEDKSLDYEGTLLKDIDDETVGQSVSVKFEAMQASHNEEMGVNKPYAEDELVEVENEDSSVSDAKDLMPSDVESTVAASEDIEEGLQDMNIDEGTLVDERPLSDLSGAEPTLDEVTQLQSAPVKLEAIAQVSIAKGLQDTNIDEATLIDEMPLSDSSGAEPTLDEVTQLQSAPVKLEVITQVSFAEGLPDTNIDEGTLTDEMSLSDSSGTEPVLAEVTQLQSAPFKPEAITQVSIAERLQDTNIDDGSLIDEMPLSDPSGAEPTLDEVTPLQSSPVKLEAITQTPTPEGLQDTNFDEGTLIDERPLSDSSGAEPTLDEVTQIQTAPVKLEAITQVAIAEGLQGTNIDERTLIDGMSPSDSSGAEPTLDETVKLEAITQVSIAEAMDVKDKLMEDELQETNTSNRGENDIAYVMPVSSMVEAEPILEEEISQFQSAPVELIPTMQVSDIVVEDFTDQNLGDGILQVMDENAEKSYIKNLAPLSDPVEAEAVQDGGVNQNMLEQCTETDPPESSILLKQDAHDSQSEAERIEGKEISSELADTSEDEAILFAPEAKVRREDVYFLSSGAALLEHPSKALTGGDDAYFVAGSKWLGVANGVNRWSFEGSNPGFFAQELLKACERIVLDNSGVTMSNPAEVISRGVKDIDTSGSSNVLVANFDDQMLHVANIGDTGFLIIRHGAIYKKSSPLLHEFHFALQVEECDDPSQLMEEYRTDLDEDDVVIFATDGLFDNLYEREIAMIVTKSLQAGMKPEEIAKVLATRAQEVGRSAFMRSPFSDAAQAAGYTGVAGGKPDHVAVIVSLVGKRSNLVYE